MTRNIVLVWSVLFLGVFKPCAGQEEFVDDHERFIYLIRHAKPDVPDETHFNYEEIKLYYQLYDSNDIIPFDKNIVLNQIHEPLPDVIFTSTLPRAKQTAWDAFGWNLKYVSRPVFNEFGRTIVHIPAVTLSKGTWSGFSRFMWVLGFHKDTESFRNAKKRAKLCTSILEDISLEEKVVILVGHGFMNHYISRSLKKNGWEIIIDDGKENLGVIKIKKPIKNQ